MWLLWQGCREPSCAMAYNSERMFGWVVTVC